MGVSAAACQAAITRTQQQLMRLNPALEQLRQKVNKELAKLLWPLGEALKWAWNKLIGLAQEFRKKVEQMLENARVPFVFDEYEDPWLKIGGDAVTAASDIQLEVNTNGKKVWSGLAGGAYQQGVEQQPLAMDTLVTKANAISAACTTIRNAGYFFYIGMAVATVSAIAAIVTAGTVAPAVAALIVAIAAFGAAVATLLLETNAASKALSANLGPGRAFPGNRWPQATA